ncbi:magnesium-translocating P-type ATPase [Candidatus Falkowbacteria bacterium]|nr:magnesium-translocating P-type ATPase [Candidatus Falkowbacteria bacterium]
MAINDSDLKNIGLSSAEARKRLKEQGENAIAKKKQIGPLLVFISKFNNPLFLLMIVISTVSFAMGQRASAVIVMMMIFLAGVLDFVNTYKSQKVVEKLASTVTSKVTAIRDGAKAEIDSKQIVVGDVVFLSAGNVVPADCMIVDSDDFFVNQSSLTGESIPVEKVASGDEALTCNNVENHCLAFMGTSVVSGFAYCEVTQTGEKTQFGKIVQELNKAEPKTDFEINIMKFSLFVMKVIFYMVSFVIAVYLIKNSTNLTTGVILQAFSFALAITIGVTPDMLPMIITVCLSKGSQQMAKKNVIVKQLTSIENFGSMDILCTDKTGTLTQDHITLVKYIDYLGRDSAKALKLGHLTSHFHTGITNPLDNAINDYKDIDVSDYKKIDEIPYDFSRKRSSMVVETGGKRLLITKGAPEEILKICTKFELDGHISSGISEMEVIKKQFTDLSADGFRVLGLCYRELPSDKVTRYSKKIEEEMIFSGFLAFLDPPKESVRQTLVELEELGIQVKILTGDNDILSQKICRDIGLEIKGVLTGEQIRKMDDMVLSRKISETALFARITPDQKERIILLLKKQGKTVGFMGDGINDAPALKAADVGISVNNAVDIAKDTADIILMEKSLESLKDGVIEGRKTFHNTMKYVLMGLSSNFGNMFSMMGAVTFLPFLPMMPAQILFNNLIYDFAQFSLPTDSVDEDDLRKPAHWDLSFIRKYMTVFGLISSAFDFLTFYLLFFVYRLTEHQFQTGWFIESIATQVFVIYIIRTKKTPFFESRPSKALFLTTLSAVVFAWSIQFTPLGTLLEFDRLPMYIMVIIASYVLVYLGLVEVAKKIFYKLHNRRLAKAAA